MFWPVALSCMVAVRLWPHEEVRLCVLYQFPGF
jgi:hypothetical protein